MFAATRIFASNLQEKMAQRFYNLVLLPTVEDDVFQNKRMNYHYYAALKKVHKDPCSCCLHKDRCSCCLQMN